MMIDEESAANDLRGKTARPCGNCLRWRARWFCFADEAFLCQACDTSVHSANQFASRHKRVPLETSSFKSTQSKENENPPSVGHQWFTRKARTPRHNKPTLVQSPKDEKRIVNPFPLVPEICSEDASPDENEEQEQLPDRVPVIEPFAAAELCTGTSDHQLENIQTDEEAEFVTGCEWNVLLNDNEEWDLDIPQFIASDAEFAVGVESLLSTGLHGDSCGFEELGSQIKPKEVDGSGVFLGEKKVKIEDEDEEVQAVIACLFDPDIDSAREPLNREFNNSSTAVTGGEEELKFTIEMPMTDCVSKAEEKRSIFLKLNYEAVITEWTSQACPSTNGTKRDFNADDCLHDFMGTGSGTFEHPNGGARGLLGGRDEDRESRVSRYREKRRTRLFSKKIRYEVRKSNAEKRPRTKGRFVKRTSFAGPSFPT